MDFRAKQIVPPKDWTTFEDLCLAIFRAEWNDPLALKNGRTGQSQCGVDIYESRQPGFGVQCKGKDRNYGGNATVSELKAELAKAEKFLPGLKHWIFATSARKDGKLQQAARELTLARQAKRKFPITVLGWEDIQSLLARHPNVVEDFYPEHSYDIAGLTRALRELPSGQELRSLLDEFKQLATGKKQVLASQDGQWDLVSFAGHRDLGPALLGRGLGPGDARACPRLQEADILISQLRRAFSARLVGSPGSGKSVCAFQAASDLADAGWRVWRSRDCRTITSAALPPADLNVLLIDDAHLMDPAVLRQLEEAAHPRRFVLSIHNDMGNGAPNSSAVNRGAVAIDPRRAVKTIASALLASPEATLAAVRRADNDVGAAFHQVPLEQRIEHALQTSDRPWQFCFILGGGWKRAKEASDASRLADADIVLASAAIIQLASRDAPLARDQLQRLCARCGVSDERSSRAIVWLVSQRLLLSENDLRCPHQRFALVVLGRILEDQAEGGRKTIGNMLNTVVGDAVFPISGLSVLLHELRHLGSPLRWTKLVRSESLEPLVQRCLSASSADDRKFASFLFSDLDQYVLSWHERLCQNHAELIAGWIMSAEPPVGFGLSRLLNDIRSNNEALAARIMKFVRPEGIARTLSEITFDTAFHHAELIRTIGWNPPTAWMAAFKQSFDESAIVALSATWPQSHLYAFNSFCSAMSAWDQECAFRMVEGFVPLASKALAESPVSAFRELDDIFGAVLRLHDPLGVYVGKLAPGRKQITLARAICSGLKPKSIAAQLSEVPRRSFQDATFFLAFLKRISASKFNATVKAIDWERIGRRIGDNWKGLHHQDEIFLTVAYSNEIARSAVQAVVEDRLDEIDEFSSRLAVAMPEIAIRHLEAGKRIRLGQYGHIYFEHAAVIASRVSEIRPDLIDALLQPFEQMAGEILSHQNASWFREISLFVRVLREVAPASLDRILDAIDVARALEGWEDSLKSGKPSQEGVALLIEAALTRSDAVGDMARQLRKKYAKLSVLKKL